MNQPDERFCGGCGKGLGAAGEGAEPRRGERRPVTVLFADLSGYTRLSSQLDPEDVHHLLERFFEKADGAVAELGGTIDKHIGDNVMALFGAPVAHDNDPERAVRAALEIHARAAALSAELGHDVSVHIGIASGEVVASGLGSQHHQAYTVTGDAANLAARLQDKAGARETMVNDSVFRATRQIARYGAVGNVEVKGLAEPVPVWRLLGLASAPEEVEQPFVGRRAETAQLRALLEDTQAERRGVAIHVRGEAGIGKTRLACELLTRAAELGFATHRATVLDFGVGATRDPVRALGESLLALPTDATAARRQERVEALGFGPELEPFVRDLVAVPQRPESARAYEQMDHAARVAGRKRAFGELLGTAAARQPVLVVVEDLQWADRATLELLVALAQAAGASAAVVAFTSRIEGDPLTPELRASVHPTALSTLDLGPLRASDALELVGGVDGDASETARRCVERAGGNPLFLLQLIENVREGGDDRLPATLQSLVLARTDRLAEAHRTALIVASVIGQRFSLADLRGLLDDPRYDPGELVAHQLLRPEGDDYLFHHALIRDGVYASLTRARRRELHARAAACFAERDATLHAEHLERAEDERASGAYLGAARGQADALQFDRAFHLLAGAQRLARQPGDRWRAAMLEGELALEVGDARRAEAAHARALDAATGPLERCRALIGRAAAFRRLSELERGAADLAEAERLAQAHGEPIDRAQIHYYRGCLLFAGSEPAASLAEQELALAQAERVGSPLWIARALSGIGDAHFFLGQLDDASESFARCVALCEEHGFERFANPNRVMLRFSAGGIYDGEFSEVVRGLEATVESTVRLADRHSEMFTRHLMSLAEILAGRADAGLASAERALALSRELGARRFEAEFLAVLAETRLALGARSEAVDLARSALALSRETGLGYVGPWVLGLLALVTDREQERAGLLAEAEALLRENTVVYNHLMFRRFAIELGIMERDFASVEHHGRELLGFVGNRSLRYLRFLGERGLCWAAWGRGDRSPELRARLHTLGGSPLAVGLHAALPEV